MARAAVIDNPVAGGGQGEALSRRAAALLADAGWDVERFSTRGPGGAFDIDPALFGAEERHATVTTKERRTAFELAAARQPIGHPGC